MKFSTVFAVGALASGVVSAKEEEKSREIVTVYFVGSTDTHTYGRFDKTSAEETFTSSGTHKYGRFDKTSAEETPSSSGTHRYGRFDKTLEPSTTTIFILPTDDGNSSSNNVSSRPKASKNSGAVLGSTGATIGVAGALAAAILLV